MLVHLHKGANKQCDAASKEQSFQEEMLSHPRAMSIRFQLRNGGTSIGEYNNRYALSPPLAHLLSGPIQKGTQFIALALSTLFPLY